MTQSLNNVAVQQFEAAFMNAYQSGDGSPRLAQTVRVVRGVVGDAYKWKLAGEFVLHDRGAFQSLIEASDRTYTAPSTSFTNWVANLPTDIFEQAEVNADERANLVEASAMSLIRRENQTVIDALAGATTADTTVVDNADNFNFVNLNEATAVLNKNNVPRQNRHIALHANQLEAALNENKITNFDFDTARALMNGTITSFMGFEWHMFGDLTEGGIALNTGKSPGAGKRPAYLYHMQSVGLAYSLDPQVTVDWSPERQSWLTIPRARLGATALQGKGITLIQCTE